MATADDELEHSSEHPEESWVKKEFALLRHRLDQLPSASRARLQSGFTEALARDTLTVDTPLGAIAFVLFGRISGGRALKLLTKQPATIEWINGFRPGGVFWDVGANVGAYTLYAARRGDTKVVAIEPAAVNYFLLAANCEANQFDDRVDALLVGLGRERKIARMDVSQFDPAHSFSFKPKPGQQRSGSQATIVISMDELVEGYGMACPNYIKIDAPGMTDVILDGAARTLARPDVRELHVELKEHTAAGGRIVTMLGGLGFQIARRSAHGLTDVTFTRE